MSFSLSVGGADKEDALAKLAEVVDSGDQGTIPEGVQQIVESAVNLMPDTGGAVSISSYGHFHGDTNGTSNFAISISNSLVVSDDPSAGIKDAVPSAE